MNFLFFKFNNPNLVEKINPEEKLIFKQLEWERFRHLLKQKSKSGELVLIYHPQIDLFYGQLIEQFNLKFVKRIDYVHGIILSLNLNRYDKVFLISCRAQSLEKSEFFEIVVC